MSLEEKHFSYHFIIVVLVQLWNIVLLLDIKEYIVVRGEYSVLNVIWVDRSFHFNEK
jgi:hypothetical protein